VKKRHHDADDEGDHDRCDYFAQPVVWEWLIARIGHNGIVSRRYGPSASVKDTREGATYTLPHLLN